MAAVGDEHCCIGKAARKGEGKTDGFSGHGT